MAARSKVLLLMVSVAALAGVLLWLRGNVEDIWKLPGDLPVQEDAGRVSPPNAAEDLPSGSSAGGTADGVTAGSGSGTGEEEKDQTRLPPSPPLPDISPGASQPERRRAFQLEKSVDHIVRGDEPFEAAGRRQTIEELERTAETHTEWRPIIPTIEERDIGGMIKKPIRRAGFGQPTGATYFGVRVVRPGENLWDIHYGIIREYFERRDIILPIHADRPMPDGRSSGVGRLLKFMEAIVRVYDVRCRRAESDLDLIHPEHSLVYFRISELFSALDQLKADDLKWLRYARRQLILESPSAQRGILEQGAFLAP